MAVFFTSDHHFGDGRRLGIDRRPFADAAAMDAAMVERWNDAVRPDDTVWHLGDFTRLTDRAAIDALLGRLHGTKHLLVGNNDGPATLLAPAWASVGHYAELDACGRRFVLCHYPFRTWNGMGRGVVNLHGHSHGRLKPQAGQADVGVDPCGFAPVSAEALAERFDRRPRRAAAKS